MINAMHRTLRACGFLRPLAPCLVVLSLCGAGCSSVPKAAPLLERIDETSGATITTLEEPMVFFRERAMLAANARDYVYIGPLELNTSGRLEYMLWAAYCSTIDRVGGSQFGAPEHAYLMLDGVPMELVRSDRRPSFGDWVYDSPVAGGERVLYRITRAQLLALAGAGDVRIVADNGGDVVAEFSAWRESQPDLRRFSRYLEGDPVDRVALLNE